MKHVSLTRNSTMFPAYGMPRQNRLHLNGNAGAKIAQGDYITITADGVSDIYEFRDSTPPLGGTAGRIWVYNGANAAASRANLASAIFGAVNAALISRTAQDPTAGTNRVKVVSVGGSPAAHSVAVVEWTTAGYVAGSTFELRPTVVSLTVTENLTEVGDVWDRSTFYNGCKSGTSEVMYNNATLNAQMILTNGYETWPVNFTTPAVVFVQNRNRAQSERYYPSITSVFLTLAGGVSPQNQPGDVLNVITFKAVS